MPDASMVAMKDAVATVCAVSSPGIAFLIRSNMQKFRALYGEMERHVAGRPLKNALAPSSLMIALHTCVMVVMLGSTDRRRRMMSSG